MKRQCRVLFFGHPYTIIYIRYDMDKRLAVRNMCIIELLFCLGLRVGELSALDMADYWPEENTVLIRGKGRKESY